MFFLIAAIVFVLLCTVLLCRALLAQFRYQRVRRNGITVEGEVIDVATTRRYNGGMTVRPIVRYRVGGAMYEATVLNRVDKPDLGSGLSVAVDADTPEVPWALSGSNIATTAAVLGGLLVLALVLLGCAIGALH